MEKKIISVQTTQTVSVDISYPEMVAIIENAVKEKLKLSNSTELRIDFRFTVCNVLNKLSANIQYTEKVPSSLSVKLNCKNDYNEES